MYNYKTDEVSENVFSVIKKRTYLALSASLCNSLFLYVEYKPRYGGFYLKKSKQITGLKWLLHKVGYNIRFFALFSGVAETVLLANNITLNFFKISNEKVFSIQLG
jgi:hypothetical protein